MSPQFREQLTRLIQGNTYDLRDVARAIQHLKEGIPSASDVVWKYYYPVTLAKALEHFHGDEEHANQAAFEFMEHLLGEYGAVLKYDPDKAGLSTWYNKVVANFFIDYYRRTIAQEPDIVYVHEQEQEMEENYGDGDDLTHVRRPDTVSYVADYPYDGVETEDPEQVQLRLEHEAVMEQRLVEIRALLYPGDQAVYDLLLENYNSDEIASILERTTKAVSNAVDRIKTAIRTVNGV